MAILKLYFAGTAGYASTIKASRERLEGNRSTQQGQEIIRLYFTGCQHPEMGGRTTLLGILDPNLDFGTDKLRSCFIKEDDVILDLSRVRANFPNSAIIDTSEMPLYNNFKVSEGCHLAHISSIEMYGFSRGAVTTFLATKKLNELDIPLRVIANEPVPGDSKKNACHQFTEGSLLQKSIDLSQCHNLEQLIVILGQYSLTAESSMFFRQMAPKIPHNTEAKLWLIPVQYHAGLSFYTEQLLRNILFPKEVSSRILIESILLHGLEQCRDEDGEEIVGAARVKKELRESVLRGLPDEPRFLPRFSQKSFHFGVLGRIQWAPATKEMMLLRLQAVSLSFIKPEKFSQVRALIATLRHDVPFSLLKQHIKDERGDLELNVALRDFINEFDAVICSFLLREDKFYQSDEADLLHFHRRVMGFIERRLSTDHEDWTELKQEVFDELVSYSAILSSGCRSTLEKALMELFSDSPLLYSELVPFLIELDAEGLEDDLSTAHRRPIDSRPTTFLELAKQLFFSSKERRKILFNEFKGFLQDLELSEAELSFLALLVPEKSVNALRGLEPVSEDKESLDLVDEDNEEAEVISSPLILPDEESTEEEFAERNGDEFYKVRSLTL